MSRRYGPPESDTQPRLSRQRDISRPLAERLKTARLERQLTQRALADKLGLGQRQISDLERGITDSRLTTVQNVARALDLELTLIPRHLVPAVEALQRAGSDAARQPLYSLDDEPQSESSVDAETHSEVGDTRDTHTHTTGADSSRPRKRPL